MSCQVPGYLVPPRCSPPPEEVEEHEPTPIKSPLRFSYETAAQPPPSFSFETAFPPRSPPRNSRETRNLPKSPSSFARETAIPPISPRGHFAYENTLPSPSIASLESFSVPYPPAPSSASDSEPDEPLTPSNTNSNTNSTSTSRKKKETPTALSTRCTREAVLLASANLQLPPGIFEYIPAHMGKKYKSRASPTKLIISADHKYLNIKQGNIFHAGMLNALILSVDSLHLLDEDAVSPFNSPPAQQPSHKIPPDLSPTALQKSIPHHPYIDIIPFPSFRDKLLRLADLNLIDGDDFCEGMYTEWGVWGSRPWDKASWEV